MKKNNLTKFFLGIFLLTSSTVFAKLPQSWITDSDELSSFDKTLENSEELEKEEKVFDSILDAKSNMIENTSSAKRHWYLQSIQSEIGIEAGGGIGVLAMKGEAFVKLVWNRSPEVVSKLQEKVYGYSDSNKKLEESSLKSELLENDQDHFIEISKEMDQSILEKEVRSITAAGFKSGKIKDPGIVREKIMSKISEFQTILQDMENYPMTSSWYPYKFQLDLSFDINGHGPLPIEIGSDFRVRLEWHRMMRKGSKPVRNSNVSMSSNSKFLIGLAEDFSTVDKLALKGSNDFFLSHIAVKVGMFAKGKLGIVKVKGQAIGGVFFKKNIDSINKELIEEKIVSTDSTFPIYVYQNESLNKNLIEGNLHQASREKFRKHLKKVEKMASFVSRGALKREERLKKSGKTPSFNLNFIELEFELYLSGGIGAVTVGGMAELELFFSRQGV